MKKGSDIYSTTISDFKGYLRLERSLSQNTISGYSSDCTKLFEYLKKHNIPSPENATSEDLAGFLSTLMEKKISKRSQARIVSSIKALYKFLEMEGRCSDNPSERIDTPKIQPYLPAVLSYGEIMKIFDSVDLSKSEGHRNRAILEVLYSCGLRVSEVIGLRISDLFFAEQFIRVIGKGSKQRLVPIGEPAIKCIRMYMDQRSLSKVDKGCEDILFLNRNGRKLTRVMVFLMVKKQAEIAGITKEISPHTFRHSFASHLVENGADLRVVQEMLGHESILTTEIYTHIDTKKWQKSILERHPLGEDSE